MKKNQSIPTTTRVSWAKGLFESEGDYLKALEQGNTQGLDLLYDEKGRPYLDEGECKGPLAGEAD